MTILEALERAKRQRDEKSRQSTQEPAGAGGASAITRRGSAEAEVRSIPRLEYEQLLADPTTCRKNRVLLPSNELHGDSAMILDAYRMVRTRIQYRTEGSSRAFSFGVVSAGPGEGKTLSSVNLALAFARDRRNNVFLVDLDLRNPCVCKYLGVTPKIEIGSVLSGENPAASAFFGIGVDNLAVAGGHVRSYANSSELLGGQGVDEILSHISSVDPRAIVLIDLPPLLVSADAQIVMPKVSAALLVVAEGITQREKLNQAVEVLSDTNVAGIVLNRSQESVDDYYHR